MVRAPCCEKMGLKKGPWSSEEDEILVSFINKHGHGNWRALPKQAGLLRCGKSCRLRWTNYLRPDIKRGNFSMEEEEAIIKLHEKLGNRWSAIAAELPGRTDNEIKNVWHTSIKKKLKDYRSHGNSKSPMSFENSESGPKNSEKSNSDQCTSTQVTSSSEISSSLTDTSCERIIIKNEEMVDYASSKYFPKTAERESLWSDELSDEVVIDDKIQFHFPLTENTENDIDEDMGYWYSLFVRGGEIPNLPDF